MTSSCKWTVACWFSCVCIYCFASQRSLCFRLTFVCIFCRGVIHRLRWRLFRTINVTRTRSISMGAYGDFEKSVQLRRFCTYRPEILHTPKGRQYAKFDRSEFRISSPEKFGAPLNFAFALRPMGRKISNRLYSSFEKNFGLIFSHVLARRPDSLTWDFREWEILVTLLISIFVCFTPPLIFLEPLKLASWNFHTACADDGANLLLGPSWLAPIGAKEGGSKYGVNLHARVSLRWSSGHLPGTNYSCVQLQWCPRRSPVNSQATARSSPLRVYTAVTWPTMSRLWCAVNLLI